MTENKSGGALGAAFLAFLLLLVGVAVAIAIWGSLSDSDGPPPSGTTDSGAALVASCPKVCSML
ncbi:hypothetical protein ABZX12_28320 [Kribbella sp. NPDC003505]|uniref:hypothetical protein n=1 Tax=Kribbella sp. NPDC003505 TaxID=3154448 RepID=UPI0033AA7CC9